MTMRSCVFPSQLTSPSYIEMFEQIELFFAWTLPSTYCTLCSVKKFNLYNNNGTSLCNFVFNPGLKISQRHIGCRNVLSTSLAKGGRSA